MAQSDGAGQVMMEAQLDRSVVEKLGQDHRDFEGNDEEFVLDPGVRR